jgi:hypothetical protein
MNIQAQYFRPLRHRVSLRTTIGHPGAWFIFIRQSSQYLSTILSGWSSSGSHPVSAAPSSAYSDARGERPVIFTHFFGVSCLLSLPSPPFVSVEIEQWDGTNWATADLPYVYQSCLEFR